MFVQVGTRFTSSAKASGLKHVHCEYCGEDYVYLINRCGVGRGTSRLPVGNTIARERAQELATINSRHRIEHDIDPVQCPYCGMFQSDMVCKLRNRFHKWLWIAGAAFVLLGAINFAIKFSQNAKVLSDQTETIKLLVLPAIGALLAAAWVAMRSMYDPNSLPADRKAAISTSSAMKYETYAEKLAQHARHGVGEVNPQEIFRDQRPAA